MAEITWLHLSDLHMNSHRVEYDRDHVVSVLAKDAQALADTAPRPDLIAFTGDLAFGHTTEESIDSQFDQGFSLLERLRNIWSPAIPRERIFLVPGNHDVRRDYATAAITQFLERTDDQARLASLMKRADKQWEQVFERLTPYREALKRHGYTHLLQNPNVLNYSIEFLVGAATVQICGLNTAWSCVADSERGKLWCCGKWQVKDSQGAGLSLCLMHHPPSWFREQENVPHLERLLESSFTFTLHGHEHDEWVRPSARHVRVSAGACYGGNDADNGFNLTTFDPETGKGVVRLRRYDIKGRAFVQAIVAGKTDNEGRWPISIEGRSSGASVAPGPKPMAEALASAKKKEYDVFFAVPMAALSEAEYRSQRRALVSVLRALRKGWGSSRVYYPAEHVSLKRWDPPDIALTRGLKAISSSRLFIMIYDVDRPSSILVEAGFALAQNVPSIYFVRTGLKLPFLLSAAAAAVSDVKVYEYSEFREVAQILREYREELREFMRPASAAPRRFWRRRKRGVRKAKTV